VRSFDGKQWRGNVDVVSGGFPCQDISAAGKGAGIDGERSGLWVEMARIIREVRPRYAFVENSPMLTSRGLGTVLGDLAEMGFDAEWGVYSAGEQGAPHERARIWIVAHADVPERGEERKARHRLAEQSNRIFRFWKESPGGARSFRDALTYSRGVDAGMARRMERLTAIGNGQVPCVAASAWRLLSSNQD
jgi:DNA (cytosine-5)-methyltransferase 1